jgi:hypothetical protein
VLAVLSTEYFGDCSASRCARMGAFGTYNKQTTTQCSAQERHQLNCTVRCSMCVPSTFFICLLKRHTQICKQSDGQSQKRAPRTKHRGGRKVRGFCRGSINTTTNNENRRQLARTARTVHADVLRIIVRGAGNQGSACYMLRK